MRNIDHNNKYYFSLHIVVSFVLLNVPSSDAVTYDVQEGQTVHLNCNITSKEVVAPVDWLTGVRRDVYIYMWNGVLSDDFKPRFSANSTSLVISNVNVSDSGVYWCVEDEGGGDQNRMFLNVSKQRWSQKTNGVFNDAPAALQSSSEYGVIDSFDPAIQDVSTLTPVTADTTRRELTALESGAIFIALFVTIVIIATIVSVAVFLWKRRPRANNTFCCYHKDTSDNKQVLLPNTTATVIGGKLMHTFSFDGTVRGFEFLHDALFMTQEEKSEIIEYKVVKDDEVEIKPTTLAIRGLEQNADTGMVACRHNHCLFLSDTKNSRIHRVDIITKNRTSWQVEGDYGPLSVSVTLVPTVLVICRKPCKAHEDQFDTQSPSCECQPKLKEYSTEGKLIRDINLDSLAGIGQVLHAVELPDTAVTSERRFCLAHAQPPCLSVIAVSNGNTDIIIRKIDKDYEPITRLNQSRHLIVDIDGSLVVVDVGNRQIVKTGFDGPVTKIKAPTQLVKLGPRLEFKGRVKSPVDEAFHWNPLRACLDVKKRRLFVMDGDGNNQHRLFSYPIDSMHFDDT